MEPMSRPLVRLLGQGVRAATKLRGGGSAFPGLVMEKLHPNFVAEQLARLPHGVVVVSGTNGKTTTTKMAVQLLESQGLRVFTNRTGSNFVRGVAASLLEEISLTGKFDADIAVLELDEAHAVHFVRQVKPRFALLLNVMRDQLDRFGEIDTTRRMLAQVAAATTEAVILNREDPRIASLAQDVQPGTRVLWYGLSERLRPMFPSDDDMRAASGPAAPTPEGEPTPQTVVELADFAATDVDFLVHGQPAQAKVHLYGVYNVYNAAGALALALTVTDDGRAVDHSQAGVDSLLDELSRVTPAFGRGETITVGDTPLQLLLVKNPAGFRLSLASAKPEAYATMIAINDEYADGRDVSWLWDVEFDSLREGGVDLVTGTRAWDMALRLDYDQVPVQAVEPDLTESLHQFITAANGRPMRVFCTYTAMLALRRALRAVAEVPEI
ncbi:Mur ligase family protein [Kocuria sp.]|uniref:Mur ligase family protein n=1 Tax=Kocuria sp. TaxID=1871328 RepID=UPI0026E0A2E7|nr:Mur ligase family protein [Kocuria sp.]MDO5617625.1 MurT ligase domain-containing protein [Kocuria sp.]